MTIFSPSLNLVSLQIQANFLTYICITVADYGDCLRILSLHERFGERGMVMKTVQWDDLSCQDANSNGKPGHGNLQQASSIYIGGASPRVTHSTHIQIYTLAETDTGQLSLQQTYSTDTMSSEG